VPSQASDESFMPALVAFKVARLAATNTACAWFNTRLELLMNSIEHLVAGWLRSWLGAEQTLGAT
jgi:hypothetical protein